ncbi:MAG TPA: hypothetical protein VFV05_09545 [Methylomirabilota bacterium]|nr:hypothetical protein [Methylomirabilota bacterium]
MIAHAIVPADLGSGAHAGFIRASWTRGAREDWHTLLDLSRRPDVRMLVAHLPDDPESLLGWACCRGDALVWVYSRDLGGRVRGRGLASALLSALRLDPKGPLRALYWSPWAALLTRTGHWRLYYEPPGDKETACA